jgi:hypothetical protein
VSFQERPIGAWPICRPGFRGTMFAAPSMRSGLRRRLISAIEPSCCCSPPQAFAMVSCAPFSSGISTGELGRFLSGAPRASVIGWRRSSMRPAPHSPTTSCAPAQTWIVRPYLFLSFISPVGPFKCAAPVSRIVRKRLRRGGIELGRGGGAHLLRHSLATQLVERRRPINEVADLLGHQSINTTALYVKVAASQLAEVALPFPGGAA